MATSSTVRRHTRVACAGLLLGFLVSCKSTPPTVAVIPRACGTALWEPAHAGAEQVARANGLKVYWNAPTLSNDVQKQIELLERVVDAKGYRGIVLAPDETLPLRTPIKQVLASHLPIVVIGTELGIDPDRNLSYVLNDEILGGRLAARRLGQVLGGEGSVAIIGLNQKLWSLTLRERSFEETLASEFPHISVVARRTGKASVAQEQEVVDEFLQSGAKTDAIVALSAESTRGAYYALVEFNQIAAIKLIGFDQDLLPPIRNGGLDSIVVQNTYRMGRLAMEQICHKLRGETVPDRTLVEPRLLTRDNIDSEEMLRIFTAHWWEGDD